MNFLILRIFLTILFPCCLLGCSKEHNSPLFKKISSEHSSITFINEIRETDSLNILTSEYIFNGGGVGTADFNNDGLPDLFFSGNQVCNELYLSMEDFRFKNISAESGIQACDFWNTGVCIVDINTDGWMDIYVCSAMSDQPSKRKNLLFVNQGLNSEGIPTFLEAAEAYNIAENSNSMAAVFFDYDKDGLLDLYVLNNEQNHMLPTQYRKRVNDGSAISNDRLFKNNGNNTFTDVTIKAGITYEGFGLGVATADINLDGWTDLYITNDYLTNDLLYINNRDGSFTNQIRKKIKHQSKFAMGLDIMDFNNDGYQDIITADMLGETNERMKTTVMGTNYMSYFLNKKWDYEYQYMRNMLQLGNGNDVPFSEIGLLSGISRTDWSWSPLFADMNNDGYKDLLITNGFPRDITDMDFSEYRLSTQQYLNPMKILDSVPIIKISNYVYKNNGNLTFENVSSKWGLNTPSFSNGALYVDLDRDGDLDYVTNNINDEAFIYKNTLNQKEKTTYLQIDLKGPKNNPMGIGTKLVLRYAEDDLQYYEHQVARGYMSSVDPVIHFGLGDRRPNSLEVLWPDGKYQKIDSISPSMNVQYANARHKNKEELTFPLVPKVRSPLFSEISDSLNLQYMHKEGDVIDFNIQRTLPHKTSQNGPSITTGDLNQDGLEDFVVSSSSKYSPTLYFQTVQGNFQKKELFTHIEDKLFEEESIGLLDLENDGDLDMILVSGGNEFPEEKGLYTHRLLINDGNRDFTFANASVMPDIASNGSVVAIADFDKDGYEDVFIGSKSPFAQYPFPGRNYLLRNVQGRLVDVTSERAASITGKGIVTDALWADINADSYPDLIVVGEFMPITFYMNQKGSFKEVIPQSLENLYGGWQSIAAADMDNDGDLDLVVGNMGANNLYQPTIKRPMELIAKDFDNNGSIDPILFAYFKNNKGVYESYPVAFWRDLSKQMVLFRNTFNSYRQYGNANQSSIKKELSWEDENTLKINTDRSIFIENLGEMQFSVSELPIHAQFAPLNDMVLTDVDKDGYKDILAVGNNYGNEIFIGRYDALNGLVLLNSQNESFKHCNSDISNFIVPGDAKNITILPNTEKQPLYLVSQNKDSLLVFRQN